MRQFYIYKLKQIGLAPVKGRDRQNKSSHADLHHVVLFI